MCYQNFVHSCVTASLDCYVNFCVLLSVREMASSSTSSLELRFVLLSVLMFKMVNSEEQKTINRQVAEF